MAKVHGQSAKNKVHGHFWDQRGTGGGGPMKMIFASTADSLYSVPVLYK